MDQFVAEIRIFPFNFAPRGWAFCDGQLLPISQNTALFALIGTTYGGDGRSTFALPDLQGRAPMQPGQGPGLSDRLLGEANGVPAMTLVESEMPSHTHAVNGSLEDDDSTLPGNHYYGQLSTVYAAAQNLQAMAGGAVATAGGGLPHNNMMPYLTLNFCIALQGIFPPSS